MKEEKDKKDIDLNKSEPDKSATINKEEDPKTPSKEKSIEEKLKEAEEKLLRSLAEIENQRRRFEKEIKDAFEFGSFNFAKENLATLDNLQRAKEAIKNDEKLKDNIKIVDGALDKLHQLRGVTFDWKRDGKSSAGVIAQDVLNVLPEAVTKVVGLKTNEEHLTVNYSALTSILIEAIKELKAEVEELKNGSSK